MRKVIINTTVATFTLHIAINAALPKAFVQASS
jgi:hypothetical protein